MEKNKPTPQPDGCQDDRIRDSASHRTTSPTHCQLSYSGLTGFAVDGVALVVGWLFNVPAKCWCVSGTGSVQTRCHTEVEVADQTFHFTQSQYTDTGPTGLTLQRQVLGGVLMEAGCQSMAMTTCMGGFTLNAQYNTIPHKTALLNCTIHTL